MMIRYIVMLILLSGITGCRSLDIDKINQYTENEFSRDFVWLPDILEQRKNVFGLLNISILDVDSMYLIEYYSIEDLYYGGIIYFDQNKYYNFERSSIGDKVEIIDKEEITEEDFFIIENLANNGIEKIINESQNSEYMSPLLLLVTVYNKSNYKEKIKLYKLQEFSLERGTGYEDILEVIE